MRSDNIKFKDIFWNTLGTVVYSAVSLFISIIIINLQGKIEGGIFSFGYGVLAHLVFIIAFFGIRPLHIIDIKYRYSFFDYIRFGKVSSLISLVLGFTYVGYYFTISVYSEAKTLCLLILVIHGAIDGFADYFECEYQRVNKLYMCGQALFFRIVAFTVTLIIALIVTQNLFISEIIAVVVEIIVFYIVNVVRSKNVFKTAVDFKSKNKNLFLEALPLFLIVFLDMYVFSATKIAIDKYIGDVYSGFFNLIFMPANVVYLVMNLFMKPILTPLTNAYFYDKEEYKNLLIKTEFFALSLSIVVMLATFFLGYIYIDIINMMTGSVYAEFSPYAKNLFLLVMAGGCFYTINTPLYYSLIIENKQKFLLMAYFITFVLSILVAKHFVINLGIMGAATGFLANMFLLCFGVFITKVLNR